MADNSKREQIILANKVLLETVSSITTVKRTLQSHSDLQEFAGPQFPLCAIVGRLPDPQEKKSGRDVVVDQLISELKIAISILFPLFFILLLYVKSLTDQISIMSGIFFFLLLALLRFTSVAEVSLLVLFVISCHPHF